ncbi:uncharacterized protein LY89DRAFT_790640 [Mollisia scopiformis]|uniref:Uncharacterized protein n=1 Tax=Mollisia scopiformis TaxID=149040 RepID=A0A132B1U7_MOLSC|nr:uncharacterized protein LY89DRAFT_790640 [Mollisia scopiformis]KUJ06356.1 hypothetical protein LY89DRAFT_790640 [Mollisia scopiformis]
MRSFTSGRAVRKALKWVKRTTQDVQWVERQVESSVDHVPALAKAAVKARVEGDPHETPKKDGSVDPWHASGIIETASGTRLTSYHAYPSGLVVFSKKKYGQVQLPDDGGESSSSSAAQGATTTDLTWRTNEQTGYAEWWDSAKWVQGDWSDEQQKWYAYYNGQWCYW